MNWSGADKPCSKTMRRDASPKDLLSVSKPARKHAADEALALKRCRNGERNTAQSGTQQRLECSYTGSPLGPGHDRDQSLAKRSGRSCYDSTSKSDKPNYW
ncbi:hypothetical protein K227x_24390 [Rubripirellula lacrimiformis]|uniref:Uncharacterized protein n=1 Tax=Rubripirellula lacrimiformis TaxID=1930273 RepID=A0A517NA95_9BACT|nr:hypothetical protein K227x_24390 [Rubripirellula lacrimiformis]